MKKFFTKAAVAAMLGGALLAAIPAEADARNRGGWNSRGHGHGGYRGGWSGRGRHFVGHGRHRFHGHRGWHRGYRHYPYYGFRRYGYGYPAYYGYGYYHGDAALAIGAGLLGVALGSALASDRYDRYYEVDRYYEYDEPPPPPRLCPDGSPVNVEGYCPAPAQPQQPPPPPPSYYLPERG